MSKNQVLHIFWPPAPTLPAAEVLILWPPDVKSWLTGKDPDAEKDWRQEEKGAAEGEMVR